MPFTSETDLSLQIRNALGEPTVKVELDDTQIVNAINETKRWFLGKKGIIVPKIVPIVVDQPEYLMTSEVDNVVDVLFNTSPDLIAFFSIGFFDILPFGFPFAFPSTPSTLQYSGYVQLLQFNDVRKRIFSIEPGFTYNQQTRILNISPSPIMSGNMILMIKTNQVDVSQFIARDEQLFWEYSLAQSMLRLGRIRRKYAEYPTAGGSTSMDGDALITDANEMIERLNQEVFDSQGPMSFITG